MSLTSLHNPVNGRLQLIIAPAFRCEFGVPYQCLKHHPTIPGEATIRYPWSEIVVDQRSFGARGLELSLSVGHYVLDVRPEDPWPEPMACPAHTTTVSVRPELETIVSMVCILQDG
jgi:hypothetical protein